MGRATEIFDFLNRDPDDFCGMSQESFCRWNYFHITHTPELKQLRSDLGLYKES